MAVINKLGVEIRSQLQQMKSDLSKSHSLDFYLYFPNESLSRAAADKLELQGFITEVSPSAGNETQWLCLAKQSLVPDEQILSDYGDAFEVIAAEYGGEYDGWESDVVQN